MQNIIATAKQFINDESGATAVEYGLIVCLIAAVIVAIVSTLGGQIKIAFTTVSNELVGKGGN